MADSIEHLPNLGPYMAKRLAEVDIVSAADLQVIGPVEAYARLKFRFGKEITLNALWALDGAVSGEDWRQISPGRKTALKAELARKRTDLSP